MNPYLTVEGSTLKAIPTKEHNTLRSLHRISKSVYVTASQPSQVAPVVERDTNESITEARPSNEAMARKSFFVS